MTIQERTKTPPKRYHVTSFNLPFAAAVDVEEAPYSVVCEMRDGGRVIFASEDEESRGSVLECELFSLRFCFVSAKCRRW